MSKITLHSLKKAIANSLREFGYFNVTADMVGEIYTAYRAGKRGGDLPHGIIGMFAGRQITEAFENDIEVDEGKP